jgi:hypothetical protein
MTPRSAARLILAYVALVEGCAALIRFRERSLAFRTAAERADALGRRLIVIGDPDAGFHTRLMRAYGCGDVCVDMNGCPRCPVTVVADITKKVPGVDDDSAVVFISCVLEYVADLNAALAEILRIAGSHDNIFLVFVQPWTLTARLYPGARWRGAANGPDEPGVAMTAVGLEEKVITSAALGLLAATAFWPQKKS